ncbi:MAG: YigZ family protein [Bacilli bacterium]|nr:YigZ family protein [Bacilli bacterium]
MYIINDTYEYILEVNKSKFIGTIFKVNNILDFNNMMNFIKDKYPKATHYVYAYRFINEFKSSDDGEPGGTSGMPIFNVIDKENLFNTAIIVVRYFGGIKLGAGGLVRAYSKCASNLIDDSRKSLLLEGYECNISFKYDEISTIDNLVNSTKCKVIEKKFEEMVQYNLIISNGDIDKFNKYNLVKIKNTYLEI